MESFFPRIAIMVVTIVLAVMFLGGIADPQKKSQNTMAGTFSTKLTDMSTSVNDTNPTP